MSGCIVHLTTCDWWIHRSYLCHSTISVYISLSLVCSHPRTWISHATTTTSPPYNAATTPVSQWIGLQLLRQTTSITIDCADSHQMPYVMNCHTTTESPPLPNRRSMPDDAYTADSATRRHGHQMRSESHAPQRNTVHSRNTARLSSHS